MNITQHLRKRLLGRATPLLILAMAASSIVLPAQAACEYTITNQWGNGFTASIKITNNTNAAVNNWNVSWQYAGDNRITNSWNASVSGSNPYAASNASWNGNLSAGQSTEFGFQGTKGNAAPEIPTLSGTLCGNSNPISSSSSSAQSSVVVSSSSALSSSSVTTSASSSSYSPPANNFAENGGVEDGLTNWATTAGTIARNTQERRSGSASALITGRTSAWNGLTFNVGSLTQGNTYDVAVWVKLAAGSPAAEIILTAKREDDADSSSYNEYSNIARATANANSWTLVRGSYTQSGTSFQHFIIESSNTSVSYYADDFSVGGERDDEPVDLVEASNPIIWADVPDPSVIRVGDTYYMTSTTMHMSPGVPVMKSTDLKNWTLINYAYSTLANTAQLNLENGQEAYGNGSWASSIRYLDGTFYVSTFSYTTNRTYIYRTNNIEGGSWTTSVLNGLYHDSALFFENGRAFLVYGVDDIKLIELTADATAIKPGGINQTIITKASAIAGTNVYVPAEGAHLQKINGRYYISLISWPVGSGRSQLIYRADNLTGPYQGRIALQDQGVAQGNLIDTPSGDWYAFLFKDSGAVGRIPYLVPVRWENGWPVFGVNGRVPQQLGFAVENYGLAGVVSADEFNSTRLPLQWQWNHNPDNSGWSLQARPGFMRITNTRRDSSFVNTRNTLTQRTFGPQSSARVAMETNGMRDGDYAGLGALQARYGYVGVTQSGGNKSIIMVDTTSGSPQEIERISLNQNRVYFRIDMDFRNQTDQARFYFSLDGSNWRAIGNTLRMTYDLDHFMGYRFALFNYGTQSTGGYVDFDYYRLE